MTVWTNLRAACNAPSSPFDVDFSIVRAASVWLVLFAVSRCPSHERLVFVQPYFAALQAQIDIFESTLNVLWRCQQDVVTPTPSDHLTQLLEYEEIEEASSSNFAIVVSVNLIPV